MQATSWEQVPGKKKAVMEDRTDRMAKKLLTAKEPVPGIRTRLLFNVMRKMQAAGWGSSPEEKEYWEKTDSWEKPASGNVIPTILKCRMTHRL